jgi:hypothetical protein
MEIIGPHEVISVILWTCTVTESQFIAIWKTLSETLFLAIQSSLCGKASCNAKKADQNWKPFHMMLIYNDYRDAA